MCARIDVSDSAGTAIASAVLKDFEGIGDSNLVEVTDYRQFSRRYTLYFETFWTVFLPCQFFHVTIFAKQLVLLEELLLEIDQCFGVYTRDPMQ